MTPPARREEDVEALRKRALNLRIYGWERAQAVNALVDELTEAHHKYEAEVACLSGERERLREALNEADRLAEWVRVTVSVDGVFSNNIGAQAQAQGLSSRLTSYIAKRAALSAGAEQEQRRGDWRVRRFGDYPPARAEQEGERG